MMQSYRHLKSLPDKSFLQSKLDRRNFKNYKEIVSNESFNNAIASYDYTTFVSLALLGTGENRQKVSSENRHFQSIKNNQS